MVNKPITLILEKTENQVFIKPSSLCKEEKSSVRFQFNPSHICDGSDCDCTYLLKEIHSNINNIVQLNLSKCDLTTIPDSVGNLPLKVLDLSHNSLKDIPNCLFKGLNDLEKLDLSHNSLSEFEIEPKCVISLRVLNLSSNSMNYIPLWIVHTKSRNLLELYYSHNTLGKTNESLYDQVHTYCLQKVVFRNCYINTGNLSFLKSISTIQSLDISNEIPKTNYNTFTNYEDVFANTGWANTIEKLNISGLRMAFIPDSLWSLVWLRELYLSENKIYWLPDFIGSLVYLEILDLSRNSICLLPNTFGGLISLHTLYLQQNNISNCSALDAVSYLTVLDLYENEIDYFDLDVLQYEYLDLEKNCFNTNLLNDAYVSMRDKYRKEYEISGRQTGVREEDLHNLSSSESEENNRFSESDEEICVQPPDEYSEEECWDKGKIKSHPDVTESDDEWQGFFPIKKAIQKPKWKFNFLLDNLFDDVD